MSTPFARAATCALALWLLHARGVADDAPPAESEQRRADDAPTNREEERKVFDAEADYLALADAPLFLPRNYLYWGTPVGSEPRKHSLVFALEYALHLPIYSNVRDQALAGKHWAGAVTLSFEGDLRMLALDSKPVRMPSYRPNLSGQLFYIWQRPQPILFSLRSGVYHYSNGQEQCTFDANLSDDSRACRALTEQVANPRAALNDRTGNFSSNGVLAELFTRIHQVNSKGVAIGHLALGLLGSRMITRGPWAMEPALREFYGWGKFSVVLEGKKRFGWALMTARSTFSYYPGASRVPAASGSVEVVLGPYWLSGIGFFARYYGGRDFYNAFFVDKLQQFAAGLAWDGERPLKFKREE